jgi:phosphatidylglycerophosphate synthase
MPSSAVSASRPDSSQRQRVATTALAVLAVAGASFAAALSIDALLTIDGAFVRRALALVCVGGAVVLALAARHLDAPSFGAGNLVTLARAALTMLLVAVLTAPVPVRAAPAAAAGWLLVALALPAVILDSFDGRLARARGEVSAFGARFDMETDALLILVLAALAWQYGKAGAWILLAGLLRYLFVAAGYVLPWLSRALPPSRRRQAVCIVQIGTLIACVSPVFPRPASDVVALAGLAPLVWSFGLDVAWLARRSRD